ncbi:MAG TPA: hypothetical protein VEV85_05090 [Bryobacteraceae bacterium]|nr:hypothetical protein [Bryobacteraceae bacterium]
MEDIAIVYDQVRFRLGVLFFNVNLPGRLVSKLVLSLHDGGESGPAAIPRYSAGNRQIGVDIEQDTKVPIGVKFSPEQEHPVEQQYGIRADTGRSCKISHVGSNIVGHLPAQYRKDSPGKGEEQIVDQCWIIERILIVTGGRVLTLPGATLTAVMEAVHSWPKDFHPRLSDGDGRRQFVCKDGLPGSAAAVDGNSQRRIFIFSPDDLISQMEQ